MDTTTDPAVALIEALEEAICRSEIAGSGHATGDIPCEWHTAAGNVKVQRFLDALPPNDWASVLSAQSIVAHNEETMAELARLRPIAEAARELPGHHYESGRLDQLGEPGEPICGECDNDWPCPNERLRAALEAER